MSEDSSIDTSEQSTRQKSVLKLPSKTLKSIAKAGVKTVLVQDRPDFLGTALNSGLKATQKWIAISATDMAKTKHEVRRVSYDLGEYGSIHFHPYRGLKKTLTDGTTIQAGDIIGVINLIKNIDKLREFDSIAASRELFVDFLQGMIQLSKDIKSGGFPNNVVAITGVSHLASDNINKKLGFDSEEVDSFSKIPATLYAIRVADPASQKESAASLFKKKWRRVHRIWISIGQIQKNEPLFEKLLN